LVFKCIICLIRAPNHPLGIELSKITLADYYTHLLSHTSITDKAGIRINHPSCPVLSGLHMTQMISRKKTFFISFEIFFLLNKI
jgi:hypothetical protein